MDHVRDLVATGTVTAVLVQDWDRFSREPAYLYLLREEFAAHKTRIKSVNDHGDDTPEGQLTDGILEQLAKFEPAKTAERSRRGKSRKPASERYSPPELPTASTGMLLGMAT